MEKGIRRCQEHNEASDTFCKTCRRIICEECEGCREHEKQGIEELAEGYTFLISPDFLEDYKINARDVSVECKNIMSQNTETTHLLEITVSELNQTIANSEEGQDRDLKLIMEATQHLREIQDKAFTTVLKEAAETAIHTLDIDDKIKEEISGYPAALEEHIKNIRRLGEDIKTLEWRCEWLNTITNAGSEMEEVELALSLCFTNKIITPIKMAHEIFSFRAFPSADKVFDVKRVETQELVEIGEGVLVSRPVSVGRELRKVGGYFHASLSHNGIVAIYSCCRSSKPKEETEYKHIIQFTDLSSTRQVEMEVESTSLVGFYDNSMVMLTYKQPLREASVESVFNNTPHSLEHFGCWIVGVDCDTDVSLLHNTRMLCYHDVYSITYEYNVDTHINKRIDIRKEVHSFASMTGIDVGVKGIFEERRNDQFTFILNRDNTITKIEGKQFGYLKTFIPSSTCPSDIKKGMLKYDGYFIFNKKKMQPTTPIYFEDCYSLIRIYKDIFLAYDDNTKQWVLVRIYVP